MSVDERRAFFDAQSQQAPRFRKRKTSVLRKNAQTPCPRKKLRFFCGPKHSWGAGKKNVFLHASCRFRTTPYYGGVRNASRWSQNAVSRTKDPVSLFLIETSFRSVFRPAPGPRPPPKLPPGEVLVIKKVSHSILKVLILLETR